MDSARQFWSTGIKKGLNLLLPLSFCRLLIVILHRIITGLSDTGFILGLQMLLSSGQRFMAILKLLVIFVSGFVCCGLISRKLSFLSAVTTAISINGIKVGQGPGLQYLSTHGCMG